MSALPILSDATSDAELVAQVKSGDVSAFEHVMRRYNRRLFRLARATLRDDGEAEDALQDAYLLAYRRIDQYRGEATLGTWLTRLVLNECLGRLRRTKRRSNVVPMVTMDESDLESLPADRGETPHGAAARSEMRSLLERKLDALPEGLRAVFVLRSVEELSVEETAASLGLSTVAVRTRHFRARGLLREALAREMDLAERDLYEFGGLRCDRVVTTVLAALRAG